MVEIVEKKRKREESLGTREITPKNVQYWSHHTGQFEKTQVHKAKKFLEHKCLEYNGEHFLCNPIKGYNKRVYTIKKSEDEFECNCQYFTTKGQMCSHILALYYAFKCKYFGERF